MAVSIQQRRRRTSFAAPLVDNEGSDSVLRGGVAEVGARRTPRYAYAGQDQPFRPPTPIPTTGPPPGAGGESGMSGMPVDTTAIKTQVAARKATAYDRYRKLQSDEQGMLNQTRVDKKGHVLVGRDAVQDKNGRMRSGGKALLSGLGDVGQNMGHGYGWGDLAGELSRAVGMAIGGLINKKWDEKRDYDVGLAKNRYEQGEAQKDVKFEQDRDKANADFEQKAVETINARVKPLMDSYMADDEISDDEAGVLQKLTGLPYTAKDWAERYRTEAGGVHYVGKKKGSDLKPDTDIPVEQSKIERNRTITNSDGKETKVIASDEKFLPTMTSITNAEETRKLNEARINSDIDRDNSDNAYSDSKTAGEQQMNRGTLEGKIKGNRTYADKMRSANKEIESQIAGLDPKEDKETIRDYRKRQQDNEKAAADAERENDELQGKLDSMPKDTPRHKKRGHIDRNSNRKSGYKVGDLEKMIHN